jgi:hypothetical protein
MHFFRSSVELNTCVPFATLQKILNLCLAWAERLTISSLYKDLVLISSEEISINEDLLLATLSR